MQLGLDSFVSTRYDQSGEKIPTQTRLAYLMEEIALADAVGLDVFAIGEHHREDFVASSPTTILAAAASITKAITLSSAVTVLSSDDPIRVYQQFATIDIISGGRAEIQVGRGSFTESYPLFGYDLKDYDLLFSEKLDLLLKVRENIAIEWSGQHRAALKGEKVYPRALQHPLPIRLGVGGSPSSFVRAGRLGLPLTVAIIGGDPKRFRGYVDLYRQEYVAAGHDQSRMSVSVHSHGFVAETDEEARAILKPSYMAVMNCIGRERGWPPTTDHHFQSECGPKGSLYVGAPATVAEKINATSEALGGIDRITLLIDGPHLSHADNIKCVELMASQVKKLI